MLLARKKFSTNIHSEYRDFANIAEDDSNPIKSDHSSTSSNTHVQRLHRRRPPGGVDVPFPRRLHMILSKAEEEGFSHIISWQSHGRCFLVHEPKLFGQLKCLNMKFTSLQRQLNLYGFRRLTRGADRGCYYHELFLRGKEFLCQYIKRTRIKGTGVKSKLDPDTEPDFNSLPSVESEKETQRNNSSKSNDNLKLEIEASNFASKHQRRDCDESPDRYLDMISEVEETHHTSRNPKSKFLEPPVLISPDTSPRSIPTLSIPTQKCSRSNNLDLNEHKWFNFPYRMPNARDDVSLFSAGKMEREFFAPKKTISSDGAVMTHSFSRNSRVTNTENLNSFDSNVPPLLCFPANQRDDVEDYFSGISDCESSLSYQDFLKDFAPEEDFYDVTKDNIMSSTDDGKKMNTDEIADWKELAEANFSSDLLGDSFSCSSLLS